LKLEDIYAKESISFILTTLPTLTIGTLGPTKTIKPTVTFVTTTPCPTVTVTSTKTLPPVTYNYFGPDHHFDQVLLQHHHPGHIHDDDDDVDKDVNYLYADHHADHVDHYQNFNLHHHLNHDVDHDALPKSSARGMNTFRLPIGWQYATPTLGGSFDPTMWSNYYSSLVKCCLALPGAYCVIDIHNWARWNNDIIGQTMSDTPYIRLWQMIASQYASEPRVIFGLMNEPYKLNLSAWAATLQRVVTAIRAIAPRHVILLPGVEFAHADTFLSSGTATTLDAIINPDGSKDNLLFDLHQWLDRGNLGTNSVCVTDNIAVFGPVVNWLRCNKRKAFLSATGGGNAASDSCMAGSTFMCKQMSYLFSNSDVIVGYTGWAAGSYDTSYIYDETPAWPANIPYADTPLVATCMYWP
ncbi:hypothetical protein FRC00_006551, partial [Tulasnella sp. 408]